MELSRVVGILLCLVFTLIILAGCTTTTTDPDSDKQTIQGSGNLITPTFDIENFTSVEISGACNAEVVQSSSYGVSITVDDNLTRYLTVYKSGDTLKVSLDDGQLYSSITFEAKISTPDLNSLRVGGASLAALNGDFSHAPGFSLHVSGASGATGTLTVADASFEVSSTSAATLTGSCKDITADVSSVSQLDLKDFTGENALISAAGVSLIRLRVTGQINGTLENQSALFYHGSPTSVNVSTDQTSTVQPAP
jgi:hypothetical protein